MKLALAVGFVLSIGSTYLYAQHALVGKYTGNYSGVDMRQRPMQYGVTLEITSVDGEALNGTMSRQAGFGACRGESPAEGNYKENKIEFKMSAETRVAGCGQAKFTGVVEGNSLVGKWGDKDGKDVKLTK